MSRSSISVNSPYSGNNQHIANEMQVIEIFDSSLMESDSGLSLFHTVPSDDSNHEPESIQAVLYTPTTADCPGGLCTDRRLIRQAAIFFNTHDLNKCFLKPLNGSYFCFEDAREGCTHIAIHETSCTNESKLVIWPLNFTTTDGINWIYLGNGSFNIAYKNASLNDDDKRVVYKIPRATALNEASPSLSSSRCVRVWNQINKQFPARIYGAGWMTPYIETRLSIHNANHVNALARWLVHLYNREGRILVDAFPRDEQGNILNFRIHESNGKANIICIDTDFALDLNLDIANASIDSWSFWNKNENEYKNFLSRNVRNKIERTTLALLIINYYLPDINLNPSDPILDLIFKKICQAYINKQIEYLERDPRNGLRFLSDKELAEKDERGKHLYHDCGLRGEIFRKIYRDRRNFTLNKINLLIQRADEINIPRYFLRHLFVENSPIKSLTEEAIAAKFFQLLNLITHSMPFNEKLSAVQCIQIGSRSMHIKAWEIERNELFFNFVTTLPVEIFKIFDGHLNQIQAQFKLDLERIEQQKSMQQSMAPRNQEADQALVARNRFFQADQIDQEGDIEIKPKKKETVCCNWW